MASKIDLQNFIQRFMQIHEVIEILQRCVFYSMNRTYLLLGSILFVAWKKNTLQFSKGDKAEDATRSAIEITAGKIHRRDVYDLFLVIQRKLLVSQGSYSHNSKITKTVVEKNPNEQNDATVLGW